MLLKNEIFSGILILGLNALLAEPGGWFRLDSPPLTAIPAENDFYAELDEQIALIGYDAPGSSSSGSQLTFTAYWQALNQMDSNYQVFVHLLDDEGQVVAQSDSLNPGDFPTEQWPLDKYVRDEHHITLPDDIPPGFYRWSVGMWLAADGTRLPYVDEKGAVLDDAIMLPRELIVE